MKALVNEFKWIIKQFDNLMFNSLNKQNLISSEEDLMFLEQVKKDGYVVINEYYSKEWCAAKIEKLNTLIEMYRSDIWVDENESDHRVYGAERLDTSFIDFYEDERINNILQTYEGANYSDGFVLGGKLTAKEKNLGSGGGWHRDTAWAKQTKAIVYLQDVIDQNGPFQYIKKSHKLANQISRSFKYKFWFRKYRFQEHEIEKMKNEKTPTVTLTGKAGTVILVDTRGIHRGKPIVRGERYALTNYKYIRKGIPESMKEVLIAKKS